jgi:hypothetical protein
VTKASLTETTNAQNTDKVETVFANLAAQVCRTLQFIADTLRDKDAHTAKRLAGDLKELREYVTHRVEKCEIDSAFYRVIKSIRLLVETQQARNYFERLFSARADAAQARHCSQQLKSALEFFSVIFALCLHVDYH